MIFFGVLFVVFVALFVLAAFAPVEWQGFVNQVGLLAIPVAAAVPYMRATGYPVFLQATFFALGALLSAWLTVDQDWVPVFSLLVSVGVGGVLAWIAAHTLTRLTNLRATIVMLVIVVVIALAALFKFQDDVAIVRNVPKMLVFGFEIKTQAAYLAIIWSILLAVIWLGSNFFDSHVGRALVAREAHPEIAAAFGLDEPWYRRVLLIAALIPAVVAGWIFAHWQQQVGAGTLSIATATAFAVMTTLAVGFGPWGAVFASILMASVASVTWETLGGNVKLSEIIALLVAIALVAFLWRFHNTIGRYFRKLRRKLDPHDVDLSVVDERSGMKGHGAPPDGTAIVTLRGGSLKVGERKLLDTVDFSVASGEVVALIANPPASADALIDVLAGDAAPDTGALEVWDTHGERIARQHWVKHGITRTYRQPKLIADFPVIDNVLLGTLTRLPLRFFASILRLTGHDERMLRSEAMAKLSKLWMREFADTPIAELSEGKLRMVEIARALAADPVLMLLITPFRGGNEHDRSIVRDAIVDMRAHGVAVVIVDTDVDALRTLADRLVVIENGRKIADGPFERLLAQPTIRLKLPHQ